MKKIFWFGLIGLVWLRIAVQFQEEKKSKYIEALPAKLKAFQKVLGDNDWFVGKQVCTSWFVFSVAAVRPFSDV